MWLRTLSAMAFFVTVKIGFSRCIYLSGKRVTLKNADYFKYWQPGSGKQQYKHKASQKVLGRKLFSDKLFYLINAPKSSLFSDVFAPFSTSVSFSPTRLSLAGSVGSRGHRLQIGPNRTRAFWAHLMALSEFHNLWLYLTLTAAAQGRRTSELDNRYPPFSFHCICLFGAARAEHQYQFNIPET